MRLSEKRRAEVVRGFKTSGHVLLGIGAAGAVAAGTNLFSTGDGGRFGPIATLLMFSTGVAVLYWKADVYSKWLPGTLGLLLLLIGAEVALTGRIHNRQMMVLRSLPRSEGIAIAIAGACLTASYFKLPSKSKLSSQARIFVVLGVVAFVFGIVNETRETFWFFGSATAMAIAAWNKEIHKLMKRHRRK